MTTATCSSDIPDEVLDGAFHWAVVLGSGTVTARQRHEFDDWLARSAEHRDAWRRVQSIEQEFAAARTAGGATTLHRVAAQRSRRRWLSVGGGLVLVALMLSCLVLQSPMRPAGNAEYVTAAGERRQIDLPGGAHLHLNSGTAVDVQSGASGPLVQLYRGEILVDSGTAAPANKAQVRTDHGRFTPLGTRFVVTREHDATSLAVIHGRVAVAAAGNDADEVEAGPGERWRVADGRAAGRAADGLAPDAWTEGIVDADNARLGTVLAALSPYRAGWLQADPDAAKLRVTGIFRLDDTEAALDAISRSLPVRIERTTDWWVRVRRAD